MPGGKEADPRAAVDLQLAVRPVQEALTWVERWRVHRRKVTGERIGNNCSTKACDLLDHLKPTNWGAVLASLSYALLYEAGGVSISRYLRSR